MERIGVKLFVWFLAGLLLAAVAWAVRGTSLPPADFTFVNGTEVKSLDPSIVTGGPEGRMIYGLFEGLVRWHPRTLEPIPGVAERWDVSDDRRVYTFHLRDNARWSDGTPVVAGDFHYAWRRFLDPRTAAQYAFQAWYIKNARSYNSGGRAVRPGDPVEVELNLPPEAINTLRGEVVRGMLLEIHGRGGMPLSEEQLSAAADDESLDLADWTFVVEVDGHARRYRYADDSQARSLPPAGVSWCRQVLLDFDSVGVEVIDPQTLRVTLENPTHFFLELTGFYPLYPVNPRCVEQYGSPQWTYPENIVCNGAFVPQFRHIRERTRLRKNGEYWNRDEIMLDSVDVLATESVTTALNIYLTGKADWIYDQPAPAMRELLRADPPRDDLNPQPVLYTYFYLLNTTRKPLDDVRVRRALSLALDRQEITEKILAAGELPAYSLVPPGMPNYERQLCGRADPERARELLAEAGYPGGRGFPPLDILYNTHEQHQMIAEVVRKQWLRELGINVKGRNEEWASYLSSTHQMQYNIARRGWVADYADPDTFLNMFVTDGEENNTGWGNPEYDALIRAAGREPDAQKRREMLEQAEAILMDELPIIPFFYYMSKDLVKPYVRGFYNNPLMYHPVWAISIDRDGQTPNRFLKGRR